MTEKANACLDTLRKAAYVGSSFDCHDCPAYTACPTGTAGWNNECIFDTAADLIESLSAELEQMERKRDAAVRHLLERHKTICPTCIHRIGTGCDKNATTGPDEEVIFCADYEWCGYER